MDYLVARELNALYILMDIVYLMVLGFLLLKFKRTRAFYFGLFGAIVYFIVDYGIFYQVLGTRKVDGADPMLFLLWLSISYGFTNFLWIWLFLDSDKHIVKWSLYIVLGWLLIAGISQIFGGQFYPIRIERMTGSYHGIMALMLVIGYGAVIIRNLTIKDAPKISIVRLLMIGIIVQFSWEAVLLVSGIRPQGFKPLLFNSLLETNLGIPYLYLIHKKITERLNHSL